MSYKNSLKINFIMNAILTASSFIFPLITFPYISRILLPEGTGKVAFVTSIISYFSMIAMLGIPTYGIRACAQVRDNREKLSKIVHEIFFINFFMTIIVYGLFFVFLFFLPQFRQEKVLYLICSSTILFNLLGMEWLYKALEEYRYITVRSVIFKFLSVLLMFLLVHEQSDYKIYSAITVLAGVGSNIINFINARKYIAFKYSGPYNYTRHLKPIFTFFTLSITTTVYTNLDITMLGFMQSELSVGYYNSAVKIKNILTALVTSLSSVLLPRSAYYVEKNLKNEFMSLANKALRFVTLISFPLCIYFISMAKESILFLSGTAFTGSIRPMQFIMPTIIFIGFTNIIGIQLLVPLGKEKLVLYSTFMGSIIDTIANALLIPRLAASGAALGTLIAEFTVLIMQLLFIRNFIKDLVKNMQLYKILLSLLFSSLSLAVIKIVSTGILFTDLVITATVFFGIYFLCITKIFHYNFNSDKTR